jgi:hypothetical protein
MTESVFFQVTLVVFLCGPKRQGFFNLGHNGLWPLPFPIKRYDGFSRGLFLFLLIK